MILQTCIPMCVHSVGVKDATIPENLQIPAGIFHYGNSKRSIWWPRREKWRFLSAGERNCFLCAAIGPLHQGRRSSILFDVFDRTEQLLDVMRWKARLGVGDRSKETHRVFATGASCWAASFGARGAHWDYTVSTVFGRKWKILVCRGISGLGGLALLPQQPSDG